MALRISALKLGCHKKPPLKEPLKKNTQQQKRSSLEAGGVHRGNRNTAQHRAPPDLGQICRWTRHPNGMRSLDLESQGWFQAWFVSIRLKISVVVEQKLEHVNHNLCKTWSILDPDRNNYQRTEDEKEPFWFTKSWFFQPNVRLLKASEIKKQLVI